MERSSPLFKQFANCAPVIGAEQPQGAPEQGMYRLNVAMQDHFVEVIKIVLDRGFRIETQSDRPEALVRPGNPDPHHNNLFVDILPGANIGERFLPFHVEIERLKHDRAITNGEYPKRGYILQFRADHMHEAMKDLVERYDIGHDERIARHLNTLHHLIDRAGSEAGYRPRCELH